MIPTRGMITGLRLTNPRATALVQAHDVIVDGASDLTEYIIRIVRHRLACATLAGGPGKVLILITDRAAPRAPARV
jgi:hypothetical protein